MSPNKTENDFLQDVASAVERVVGPQKISRTTLLKRDLKVDSVHIVDISFELENVTGLPVKLHAILLGATGSSQTTNDLEVQQIINHLMQLSRSA